MSIPTPERQAAETQIENRLRKANRVQRWLAGITLLAGGLGGYPYWQGAEVGSATSQAGLLVAAVTVAASVRTQFRARSDCSLLVAEYAAGRGVTKSPLYKPTEQGRGAADERALQGLTHDFAFRPSGPLSLAFLGAGGNLLTDGFKYPEHLKVNPDIFDFTTTAGGLGEVAFAMGAVFHLTAEHANGSYLASCRAQLNNIDGWAA